MSDATSQPMNDISPVGKPAPLVRHFGWLMLSLLGGFLVDNILMIGFDWPSMALAPTGDWRAIVQILILLGAAALGALHVIRTPDRALRWESRQISNFNAWFIRGCYFAVLFVGITDATIAFLRVEGFLESFFPEDIAKDLIRSRFVGTYVHTPLTVLGFVVAWFSRTLGFIWLALLIVVAELLIVFSRFVFSYEQALMGDLVRYWYAALFLFASAYTLKEDGHVRVDVLYSGFDLRKKGRVNAWGSVLLGMTTCWTILLIGMGSSQSIINSPLRNFEVSQTGTAGMFIKYHMAAFLAVFAVSMLIQFVAFLFDAVADARGEPGHVDHEEATIA